MTTYGGLSLREARALLVRAADARSAGGDLAGVLGDVLVVLTDALDAAGERDAARRQRAGWKRVAKMYRASARHRYWMWERAEDRTTGQKRRAEQAERERDAARGWARRWKAGAALERDLRHQAQQALDDGYARLRAAGVTSAVLADCDDPTCQSIIGHEIRSLAEERDRLAARLAAVEGERDAAKRDRDAWKEAADAVEGRAREREALRVRVKLLERAAGDVAELTKELMRLATAPDIKTESAALRSRAEVGDA